MKKEYMTPAVRVVEMEHAGILMGGSPQDFEANYGSETTDDDDNYPTISNSFDVDNDFGWRE